jgi:hypothetical protein
LPSIQILPSRSAIDIRFLLASSVQILSGLPGLQQRIVRVFRCSEPRRLSGDSARGMGFQRKTSKRPGGERPLF